MDKAENINETLGNMKSIRLRNIDLSGVTLSDQSNKWTEEYFEFVEACNRYDECKTSENRKEVIKELLDMHQVDYGLLDIKYGIKVDEIMDVYNKEHYQKMDHRPRD